MPASFDFCRANLKRDASSSGTSIPSESLKPTARLPPSARALSAAITRILDEGDYPQLRAMIGDDDPIEAFAKNPGFLTQDRHFDIGLDALLDGLARRFKLK